MGKGFIIFLNGPSSSGKTAIVKVLQELLEEPFLHVGVDMFYHMMPKRYFGIDPSKDDPAYLGFRWKTSTQDDKTWYDLTPGTIGYRMLNGMHRAIAAIASAGNNIIVDENVIYEGQMEGYLRTLKDFDVLFVGVHCSLDEIERREHERGDRWIGHAKGHYHLTHAFIDEHGSYDLEIDSTNSTPEECAMIIAQHYNDGPAPSSFSILADKGLSK